MKLHFNAPVVLTFSIIASIVLLMENITGSSGTVMDFFTVGNSMDFGNPADYFRLVSHIGGHANWGHLFGNFTFILLIGPLLEEKYGSGSLLFMMVVTALVTSVLNILFLPTGLLGASGIVFMMIMLSSATNMKSGKLPITFILILLLYLGREVWTAVHQNISGFQDGISHFAHIIGGIAGSVFGFIAGPKAVTSGTGTTNETKVSSGKSITSKTETSSSKDDPMAFLKDLNLPTKPEDLKK